MEKMLGQNGRPMERQTMRQVEIAVEPKTQRPWLAVDKDTGRILLRMDRLEMLLRISAGLGWEVDTAQADLLSVVG